MTRSTGIRRGASSTATEPALANAGDCYCYLPLYVFCGRHLLAARLRRSNIDASAGAVEEVARIVAQIRRPWPKVRILLRADSGFAREPLMAWCEANRVDFVFGLARNPRLVEEIAVELIQAEAEAGETGKPARRYRDLRWSTRDSWSRRRRVIGKAEWTRGEANPRLVPGSCMDGPFARGLELEMENRIKSPPPTRSGECQADLFADRTSAASMRANQLRLWFASMAGACTREGGCADLRAAPHRPRPHPVRRGHPGSSPGQALRTIRLKLLKIGALVRTSVRRVKIATASAHPWQAEFALAHARLSAAAR